MRDYRVRVRMEKMDFFEELMKNLNFCEYEMMGEESDLKLNVQMKKKTSKASSIVKRKKDSPESSKESIENLREAMSKIDAQRDGFRRK